MKKTYEPPRLTQVRTTPRLKAGSPPVAPGPGDPSPPPDPDEEDRKTPVV